MRISTALSFSLLFISIFFSAKKINGQDSFSFSSIDINTVDFVKPLSKNVYSSYIHKKDELEKIYSSVQFTPGLIHSKTIPNKYVTQKAVLKFKLCNSGDSPKGLWFAPGFFYSNIQLYQLENNIPKKLVNILPDDPDSIGYRYISLAAKDSATFLAELSFVKTYINSINPRLIQPEYLDLFIKGIHHSRSTDDQASYVFCGLFLMMMLFSFASFLQGGNPEFLYYSGYAFLWASCFSQRHC